MTTAAHLNSVNVGSNPNDGTGSTIRDAFEIVNDNVDKINQQLNGTGNQSSQFPVTFITATNDIYANTGIISGAIVTGGVVYSRGSEVLTSSTGSWNGGNVNQPSQFSNTLSSTSTTTGALQVWGGLGVRGNINVGGSTSLFSGNISVSGTSTVGNLYVAGATDLIGDVRFGNLYVYSLTGNILANVVTANSFVSSTFIANTVTANNISASSLTSGTVASSVVSGSYAGITAVGTLTGLTVSGNTAINNTLYGRGVFDNGSRVLSNVTVNAGAGLSGGGSVTGPSGSVTLSLPATGPGVTTVGGASSIPVITTDAYGRITGLTSATPTTVTTTISINGTAGVASVSGGGSLNFGSNNGLSIVAGGSSLFFNLPQGLLANSTPTFSNVIVGNIFTTTNSVSNIGSVTNQYNTIFARATSAQYADLAENYSSDQLYDPGTVLMFGGDEEVTLADVETRRVAGVVSTEPAYLMNGLLDAGFVVSVALQGRVPCKVVGPVAKGDMLVSAGGGYAKSQEDPRIGSVIGKALSNFSGTTGVIEVVVGRL